jgi:hypothetical protein
MDANDREDYAAALREWGPPAEQGDALAQINLGVCIARARRAAAAYPLVQ